MVNEQIKQIAMRMKGLREDLEMSVEQMANICAVSAAEYTAYESGEKDIPVSILHCISQKCDIEMTALLFGENPHMRTYYLTRKGEGTAMERTKAYKYQSLAAGFIDRKADPFVVAVEPNNDPIHLNSHPGQEFNMVLEGSMLLSINGKELTLNEGDSIYFDSNKLHGMKALNNKPVKFLAIIL
ncbi:MAG: XRE family transcriptional regulator [Paludibacteraceae bacterium]|nr:XRE family transcriptional regulator [Paludibacteraceae bacterium]